MILFAVGFAFDWAFLGAEGSGEASAAAEAMADNLADSGADGSVAGQATLSTATFAKASAANADFCWGGFSVIRLRRSYGGQGRVAVGTIIADRPPHRSVRALLVHTAPTSDA